MKVSAEWLAEYIGKHDPKTIADALEQIGVEIEQIIYTPKLDNHVVVADVKKVIQHPNADKLKIVELSLGEGKISVVCGAANVSEGQKVAYVAPGVTLPTGLKIEKATIRGIESAGMIASAQELGLGDDHSGILVLEPSARVGQPVAEIWPESAIIDVYTPANRPDLLSVIGLAREAAAFMGEKVHEPIEHQLPEKGAAPKVKVDKSTKTRRYMAVELSIEPNQKTPDWMQRRLLASGLRPISVVVDITNYVMLEYGQPLHAFDAAKVRGSIVVRHAGSGEKLVTLDGQTRKLTTEDVVIANSSGPIALAGVMGGAGSEITDKTTKIILESASFDAPTIRKTAIRHGNRTDASGRFERNLPVQLAPIALARALDYLSKYAKAKVTSAVADELLVWPWIQHIGIRSSRLEQFLGYKISREEITKLLHRSGLEAEPFDVVAETKKHLGKPYVWGASFKKNGIEAFDCGYLIDYVFSLIGLWVGHTAPAQLETGRPVHTGELSPGDILFYEGIKTGGKGEYTLAEIQSEKSSKQPSSTVGYYYRKNAQTGQYEKLETAYKGLVGHDGIYIGNGKVIDARRYEYRDAKWVELPIRDRKVQVVDVEVYIKNPGYIGARRHVENLDDYVAVTAPWWRTDLKTEEDLIEEIARLTGYDKVPAKLPAWQPSEVEFDQYWPNLWKAQEAMKALGMFEVMTYSFVSADDITRSGCKLGEHLKVRNPMSIEQAYLRTTLLPSLLNALGKNQTYAPELSLFEVSKVYLPTQPKKLPSEPTKIAAIAKADNPYASVKAALDRLVREFKVGVKIEPAKTAGLHPGRAAKLLLSGKEIGWIGEVHPDVVTEFKIKGTVAYLEVDLLAITSAAEGPNYRPVSKFPAAKRDLSIVVNQKTSWQDVAEAIDEDLAEATYLSEFSGQGIPAGKKSVAFRLVMSDSAKTLTDAEVEDRLSKISNALKTKFKAEIR